MSFPVYSCLFCVYFLFLYFISHNVKNVYLIYKCNYSLMMSVFCFGVLVFVTSPAFFGSNIIIIISSLSVTFIISDMNVFLPRMTNYRKAAGVFFLIIILRDDAAQTHSDSVAIFFAGFMTCFLCQQQIVYAAFW